MKKRLTIMFLMLIFMTSCSKEANPVNEQVKELQDDIINLQLAVDTLSEKVAEQKTDIQTLKTKLDPDFKPAKAKDIKVPPSEDKPTAKKDPPPQAKKTPSSIKPDAGVVASKEKPPHPKEKAPLMRKNNKKPTTQRELKPHKHKHPEKPTKTPSSKPTQTKEQPKPLVPKSKQGNEKVPKKDNIFTSILDKLQGK